MSRGGSRVAGRAALLALLAGCAYKGGVADGDYELVSQGVGGRRIEGDLDLSFATDGEVAALSCVTEVSGDVLLYNNPGLTSLSGLERLESIGGDLSLVGATGLESLEGLSGLRSASNLTLQSLDVLPDLAGLDALDEVGAINLA